MAATILHIHGVRKHPQWGRDPRVQIAASARIGSNPNIGPFITIDADAVIGDNVILYPGCYIGKGAVIGDDVTLYPNVVIYDGSRIGNRVSLHSSRRSAGRRCRPGRSRSRGSAWCAPRCDRSAR